MDITTVATGQLVNAYNRLTGKKITKFSTRANAEKQVLAIANYQGVSLDTLFSSNGEVAPIKAKPKKEAKPKPVNNVAKPKKEVTSDRGKSISKSWGDAKVAKARSKKDRVIADGTEFKSLAAAFTGLKLPMVSFQRFRKELKAEGSATFKHEMRTVKFKIKE